jgi:hypothetical protein
VVDGSKVAVRFDASLLKEFEDRDVGPRRAVGAMDRREMVETVRMATRPEPGIDNGYLADHVELLRRNLRRWTGRDLVAPGLPEEAAARLVYDAPFVVLSHSAAADPVLTYGNRAAQSLFELTWDELTRMPSRLTAEASDREERARLLAQVGGHGYIDDYSGVRVSRTGRRFRIARATVWTLLDDSGRRCGQAATFAEWRYL